MWYGGELRVVILTLLQKRVEQVDFCNGPWTPSKEYDLCLCTEFVEHVHAQYEDNFLGAMEKCKCAMVCQVEKGIIM
jgi:hypothetical protein